MIKINFRKNYKNLKFFVNVVIVFIIFYSLNLNKAFSVPPPPSQDFSIKEGSIIKGMSSPKVYVITKGMKHWLPTPEILKSYGYSWKDIKIVDSSILQKFKNVYLIRKKGGTKVYYIKNNLKKWIRTPDIFNSYNNKWEDIIEVSEKELSFYKDVFLIRKIGDYKVYKIEGNTKRHIASPEAFRRLGYSWQEILEINEFEFNWFKTGQPIY